MLTAALLLGIAEISLSADAKCVLNQVSSEDRLSLGTAFLQEADAPEDVRSRMRERVLGCARQFGWDRDTAMRNGIQAMLSIGLQAARAHIISLGIDADGLDRWFDAQNDDVRLARPASEADARLAVDELLSILGVQASGSDELISRYIMTRAILERAARGLPLR